MIADGKPACFLIEASMSWKRGQRLKLVSESEAPSPIRAILREVRESLGVPAVPVLYQAYAAFPEFLELHWQAFRPFVRSQQFFLLGCRLGAESYTRAHNYFEIRALPCPTTTTPSSTVRLPQVLDYYQYLDPLLLLIAVAQMQAFEGPVGELRPSSKNVIHPEFTAAPSLLRDEQAGSQMQRRWNERKRLLGLALDFDEHRALACWPEFYVQYWAALKEVLRSPVYADCQYRLAESAVEMTTELPARVETDVSQLLDRGFSGEQATSVMRINEAFMQALTGLLLDVTFARIGCEGGTPTEGAPHKPPVPEHSVGPTESPVHAA